MAVKVIHTPEGDMVSYNDLVEQLTALRTEGWLYVHRGTGERRVSSVQWRVEGAKWPKNWEEFRLGVVNAIL